jgi:hypothetical protein
MITSLLFECLQWLAILYFLHVTRQNDRVFKALADMLREWRKEVPKMKTTDPVKYDNPYDGGKNAVVRKEP